MEEEQEVEMEQGVEEEQEEVGVELKVELAKVVRKRRRSVLGEGYDTLVREKRRRRSRAEEAAGECPVPGCRKGIRAGGTSERRAHLAARCLITPTPPPYNSPSLHLALRHLIGHLRRPPCRLYREEGEEVVCGGCGLSTSSPSSLLAHRAVAHRDLHTRLGAALEAEGLGGEEAELYRTVDVYWKQVWVQWRDEGRVLPTTTKVAEDQVDKKSRRW